VAASFVVVDTANGVSLDYLATEESFAIEHCAFLVSEQDFDAIAMRPSRMRDVSALQ
jgi:hypothetical protein